MQDILLRCITDAGVDASDVLAQAGGFNLNDEERCAVVALRGLLACHILEHSLQMRHLVDYGVNRCGSHHQCLGSCTT
jgi:hypothetical protein